ncbi:MAG: hypothetical protein AAGI01_06815 [Myxococcota bacterium]
MKRSRHRRTSRRKATQTRTGRRTRRTHRRDIKRGASYTPIVVPPGAVKRGVQLRLLGAAVGALVTLLCLGSIIGLDLPQFTMMALASLGAGSVASTVAMALSARREEHIHQLASDLMRPIGLLEHPNATMEDVPPTDGSV